MVKIPESAMLLTVSQAAELLQIGRDTVYQLTHIEGFPALRIGRSVRINREQLQTWLNNNGGSTMILLLITPYLGARLLCPRCRNRYRGKRHGGCYGGPVRL